VVLEYARHLLNTASNIFDDIEHAIGTGRHRIRVGAIPSAVTLTAAVIARYNQAHDEHVEILLQDMPNDALLDACIRASWISAWASSRRIRCLRRRWKR
jgi:DNA-binding transcriptional LysR family regulator